MANLRLGSLPILGVLPRATGVAKAMADAETAT
jgi:hypothetical protein